MDLDGATDGFVPGPAAPAAPIPVTFDCPEGWQTVIPAEGPNHCEPWSVDAALDCADGEARMPGDGACAPLGPPCAAGDFAEGLPSDRPILYVLAGAAAGGDGTMAAPFTGLLDVSWATLATNSTVALGEGTYPGEPTLRGGVELRGKCAAETVLTSDVAHDQEGVVMARGAGTSLRDLSIEGPARPCVSVESGADLVLEAVHLRRCSGFGLTLRPGSLGTVRAARFSDTRPEPGAFDWGTAIYAAGASLSLSRAHIEGSRDVAVFAGRGSTFDLSDLAIRETDSRAADGDWGVALLVQTGSQVSVERALTDSNRWVSVQVGGSDTHLDLNDALIRRSLPRSLDGAAGVGFGCGGEAVLRRVAIVESASVGVGVEAQTLSGADVIIRDSTAPNRGAGVQVNDGSASFERIALVGSVGEGLFASGATSSLSATDAEILDTRSHPSDGFFGTGVVSQLGARVEVTRARIARSHNLGAFAGGAGSLLELTDTVVEDTEPRAADGRFGRGIQVESGARAQVTRARVLRSTSLGIALWGLDTAIELVDVEVRDIRVGPLHPWGRGLEVDEGAEAMATRLLVADSRGAGVSTFDGTLLLDGVQVIDTRDSDCPSSGCPPTDTTTGLGAYNTGTVTANDFAFLGSDACGVHVASAAQMDLSNGVVGGSVIGACVQVDGYDVSRLSNAVRFIDNETNLDSTSLPVPEASAPVEGI